MLSGKLHCFARVFAYWTCILVFSTFLHACAPERNRFSHKVPILLADIQTPADELPEAKSFPSVQRSEGNQISHVVRSVFEDERGHYWFASQNGLARYDGTELAFFDFRDQWGSACTGTTIVEDTDGSLWLGTDRGLFRYENNAFLMFTEADGLPSSSIWSLYLDRTGTLWVGTTKGACFLEGDRFVSFPLPEGTTERAPLGISNPKIVSQFLDDRKGNFWFAAQAGLFRYDGNEIVRVPVMENGSATFVCSMLEDRSGQLWLGTVAKGLIRFDGTEFVNVTKEASLPGLEAGGLMEDSRGNIWFTVEGAGAFRYDGESYTRFFDNAGLDSHAPHGLTEDRRGRIWAFGWNGAYRMDGDTFVNVTRDGPW